MRITKYLRSIAILAGVALWAQNPPGGAVDKLDTPQVHAYVATLLPHKPVASPTGHPTDRVLIYLDNGIITRKDDNAPAQTIEVRRGQVRWRPASGPYVAECISDHSVRILEIDLKGKAAGPAPVSKLDPVVVDAKHYKVDFENDRVRILRVHYDPHEKGELHEHILNRVVLYLNDQSGGKMDDVHISGAATHTEENAGDQPADRIAVEIK